MPGSAIFAYATLDECKAIYDACKTAILEGQGTVVVGISGGGESETRAVITGMEIHHTMMAAMRRMSQINPTQYPPLKSRMAPDFSGGVT